jgi:hypothetical protein
MNLNLCYITECVFIRVHGMNNIKLKNIFPVFMITLKLWQLEMSSLLLVTDLLIQAHVPLYSCL